MQIDRAKFFAGIRNGPFPGRLTDDQVRGTTATLDAFETRGPLPLPFQSYMLATEFHETAHTMLPIEEYGHGRGRVYGKPTGPWHCIYDGRGDVQLTWEANYIHATKRLRELGVIGDDIDLDRSPELAMRPDIAAAIMIAGMVEGWFTKFKLNDYFNDKTNDPVRARKIINGLDKADTIANYHRQFYAAITAAKVAA